MKNTGFDFPNTYFENRKTIRFFFETNGVDGLLFCVSNYLENNRSINESIIKELSEKGKHIGLFNLEWKAESGPITQFKHALEIHPDGLILNNLDSLIDETEGEVITTLNYAREGLLALGKPILCWLTEAHYTQFIQRGADLYSRRSFSSLHFEDLNLSKPHDLLESRFSEQAMSEEEFTNRKHRLQLLERQVKEAEESGYPKEKIAKEMVFDLLLEYSELKFLEQIKTLLQIYKPHFKKLSFDQRNILGNCYLEISDLQTAKDVLENLVKDAESKPDLNAIILSDYQSNLAQVLWHISGEANLLLARDYVEKALATRIQKFRETEPSVASEQSNLALVLRDLGGEANLLQAKAYLEKALATEILHFGEKAPTVAVRQSNLALVLQDLSGEANLLQAKAYLDKALATNVLNFGEKSPTVAKNQSNLATVLQDLGGEANLLAAKSYLEKAIATDIHHFGEKAPTVAVSQSNLSMVLKDIGGEANLLQAKTYLEKALASGILHFGETAPTVALKQYNLGTVLYDLNELPQALAMLEKAYSTFHKTMGPNHGHTQKCLSWLEGVRRQLAD